MQENLDYPWARNLLVRLTYQLGNDATNMPPTFIDEYVTKEIYHNSPEARVLVSYLHLKLKKDKNWLKKSVDYCLLCLEDDLPEWIKKEVLCCLLDACRVLEAKDEILKDRSNQKLP